MANKTYGVNGTAGIKYTELKGWENETVGPASSVKLRLGAEQGIRSDDPNVIGGKEPFRQGRFAINILRDVPFHADEIKEYMRYFLEDMAREFSGISNNQMEKMSSTTGANRRTEEFAGTYKENNYQFTIKIPEYAGSPARKAFDYWVFGMSDPVTNTGHLWGRNMRYIKPNYSMDILYTLLGPSGRPDDIEFAALYLYAFPDTAYMDHLNSGAIGEVGTSPEFDIPFTGIFYRGDQVNALAKKIVSANAIYKDSHLQSILPAYIYEEFLNVAEDELSSKVGGNIYKRLQDDASKDVYSDEVQSTAVTPTDT